MMFWNLDSFSLQQREELT